MAAAQNKTGHLNQLLQHIFMYKYFLCCLLVTINLFMGGSYKYKFFHCWIFAIY